MPKSAVKVQNVGIKFGGDDEVKMSRRSDSVYSREYLVPF